MPVDPRKLPDMPELMIAGPGELHEEDLEILGRQVIAHYGDVWTTLHAETLELLGDLLGARDVPYLIPGTGTTCLDAAAANLFEPGQRVVVANTGFFGIRAMEVARAHGLDVVEVPVEPGDPVDPARVGDVVDGCDGVLTVHVETATGVRHPIREIAEAAHAAGALCMVDGIASVGGELAYVDDWGLDALVTGTQKGLDAPPGLGVVALSQRARERVEARSTPVRSWYLDFKRWDWYREHWGAWHPHPVTMPTNLVLALNSSLRRILEEGLDAWVDARSALARRCRDALEGLGFEAVPAPGYEANLVVAMWVDDPAPLIKYVLDEEHIMISGGLDPTMGKAIRVGLMGRTATPEMVERVASGLAKGLRALGRV